MIKFYDPLIEMLDIYYSLQVIVHLYATQVNSLLRCVMNNYHIHKTLIISAENRGKFLTMEEKWKVWKSHANLVN